MISGQPMLSLYFCFRPPSFVIPAMNTPKTFLITGANKGIGFEIARQLAKTGAQVFLGARDAGRGQAAADELGGSVEFLPLDVSDAASIDRAAEALASKVDALDGLINNAGILDDDRGASILDTDAGLIHRTLDTNTFGPLRLTQKLAGLLEKAADGGRVVNLSSGLGQLSDMEDQYPAYSISKTALNAVTRQLAAALKGKGIAVNTVCPGWVKTDMGGEGASRTVEQGADTPVWLVTEAPAKLTGEFLRDRKSIPW